MGSKPVEDVGRAALEGALALLGTADGAVADLVRQALTHGVAPERPMLACESCKGTGLWKDTAFREMLGRPVRDDDEREPCFFCKGEGETRSFWPRIVRSWELHRKDGETGPVTSGWQGTGYVRIRPCDPALGDRTYLGYLVGEVPLSASVSVDDAGHMVVTRTRHNPAIMVFALGKVVYGIESWWGLVEGPDDLKGISDDEIGSVWYVAALEAMTAKAAKARAEERGEG